MWPIIVMLILALLALFLVIVFRVSPREPTRNLYMAYYEDGLWEAYLGLVLLLIGLAEWFGFPTVAVIPVLLYPILLTTKQAITAPRLDPADLPVTADASRRKLIVFAVALTILMVLGTLVLMTGSEANGLRSWLDRYLAATVWLLVIGLFAVWGYRTGIHRLLIYVGLFLVAFVLSLWFQIPLSVYGLTLGTIIFLSGLIITVRFVRSHPKLAQG